MYALWNMKNPTFIEITMLVFQGKKFQTNKTPNHKFIFSNLIPACTWTFSTLNPH